MQGRKAHIKALALAKDLVKPVCRVSQGKLNVFRPLKDDVGSVCESAVRSCFVYSVYVPARKLFHFVGGDHYPGLSQVRVPLDCQVRHVGILPSAPCSKRMGWTDDCRSEERRVGEERRS